MWKSSLSVFEEKNRVGATKLAGLLLGLCLAWGCMPRQPAENLYLDAVALRELGQDRLAVDKLNDAVKADPDFVPAYAELGQACRKLGEHEKALAAFRQATRLDPWSFEYQLDLAGTYEKLGKHPQAADAYGRAVELDPNSLAALTGAAGSCLKAEQYARAQAYCEQDPEHSQELLPVLACAYEGQKDYARAIEVYQRLLARNEQDPNVLFSLGVACVKAERYDRAREVLASVTLVRPQDGAAFRHLGYSLIKLGDTDQAMQAYRKAIDLGANDWEAYRGLGVACMVKANQTEDGRWQEQAIRHWRRSLAINPDQPKRQTLERLIREHSKQRNPLQGLSY